MDIFVWSDRYMTGEALVDSEHQELVRIINWVVEHQSLPEGDGKIREVLDQLASYAVMHFGHEEALMAREGCDRRFIEAHVAVHREFARQVGKMLEFGGRPQDIEYLLRFLSSWLAHHILGIDQSMARQIAAIRSGTSPEAAYEAEKNLARDPTNASLLDAMNALFRMVASRNEALETANAGLEVQVAARTEALTEANQLLRVEHGRLHRAMAEIELGQQKLLESEQKRSEAEKRNMQQLLAQIIDGDPVPTFVIDAEHRITHWNRACALISRLSPEQMIGTSNQWQAFYPEARPVMADLIVNGSLEEGYERFYKNHFKRSTLIEGAFEGDGFFAHMGEAGLWLAFTAAPLHDADGALIGAIETLQDVTERRRAEERLLQYQNELESQVVQRTAQLAKANVELENERHELELLLSKVDEAQQQLLQSEKMAAIGQLAAGVAHEINNPVGYVNSNLGSLKTYVERLLNLLAAYEAVEAGGDRQSLVAAQKEADIEFLREDLPLLIEESREGLSRVTKIVQDLKDFSRIDQAERQSADLNAALESTLNVVWNEIKYKAEVIRELGEIPKVDCVPAHINQVFMNLLVNAAQAIEKSGTITLRSGLENNYVWFEVADTGSGIPEAVRQRIFEPFFTTKPIGKGTGLGLSISYDIIVKRHGGRFDVTSEPGKGTCFRIWLPVHSPVSA